MNDPALLVLCTAPSAEVGARLARGLVEAKLAACVNLVPGVRSIYAWNGAVHDESEVQLLIKTRGSRFDEVQAFVRANHPYEVPEVLAIRIDDGSAAYLAWLGAQTTP